MWGKSKIILIPLVVILLITGPKVVLGSGHDDDIEGASDHPLISRFPGSIIRFYETETSTNYILPTGEDVGERNEEGELIDGKEIVGDVTRITYEAPENTSTHEIFSNYESALEKAGFDIILTGDREELGWFWTIGLYNRDINPLPGETHRLAISEEDFYYLSAELTEENEESTDIYVSLSVAKDNDGVGIQLDIIEEAPPAEDLIEVNLDNLAREIEEKGSVSIHNIYFETGEAEIQPESEEALKAIADLLNQDPDLELYVVGHTDNQGSLEFNMDLSASRAEAVVNELVSKYNIEQDRLKPQGVAFLAPKASNSTEEGRAFNRRVELVKS